MIPSVFIASSSEMLPIAEQIQFDLQQVSRPVIWSQGVFGLGWGTLESLIKAASTYDFSIIVFGADDSINFRGDAKNVPRDNVIFELGLFIGKLGQERTYVLYDKTANLHILSDLAGITKAAYDGVWATTDLAAAIGAACQPIRLAIKKLGVIPRS